MDQMVPKKLTRPRSKRKQFETACCIWHQESLHNISPRVWLIEVPPNIEKWDRNIFLCAISCAALDDGRSIAHGTLNSLPHHHHNFSFIIKILIMYSTCRFNEHLLIGQLLWQRWQKFGVQIRPSVISTTMVSLKYIKRICEYAINIIIW